MNVPPLRRPPAGRARQGVGVVFMISVGVMIVLAVFLGSQFMTQRSTSAEIGAIALGARAQLACESAITEAAYRVVHGSEDEANSLVAYEALRSFTQKEDLTPNIDSDYSGKTEYLLDVPFQRPLTEQSYEGEEDIEFGAGLVGLVEREGFPGERELMSWDHRGLLAFEQEVTVTPPYGGFSMKVQSRFLRAFRALVVNVPPPFSRYRVVLGGDGGPGDHFLRLYEAWQQARDRHGDAVDDFPILQMEEAQGRHYVTGVDVVSAPDGAWNVDELSADAGSQPPDADDGLNAQLAAWQGAAGFRRASEEEDRELRDHLALFSAGALANRSTFQVVNSADLTGYFGYDASDGLALDLDGVVHVKGPLVLDHGFKGRGILWTDHAEGIRVRSLTPSADAANDAEVILVATRGDIEIVDPDPTNPIAASLIAPQGTVKCEGTAQVVGHLVMHHLPAEPYEKGPTVRAPPSPRFKPDRGRELNEDEKRQIQIFFDQGFVRKDARRRRASKGLLGG